MTFTNWVTEIFLINFFVIYPRLTLSNLLWDAMYHQSLVITIIICHKEPTMNNKLLILPFYDSTIFSKLFIM